MLSLAASGPEKRSLTKPWECLPCPLGRLCQRGDFNGEAGIRTQGTGISPYNGLANRRRETGTTDRHTTCGETAQGACHNLCQNCAEKAPDLAAVVVAWPTLPEAIKTGILAMVKASGKGGGS